MSEEPCTGTDTLIDLVITEAEIEDGLDPSVISKRTKMGQRAACVITRSTPNRKRQRRGPNWTEEENEFVKENLGKLSMEEMGKALGRSTNSIKLKLNRSGWTAASRQADEISCRKIADLMAKCGKTIGQWIDAGILPGRELPMKRRFRVVKRAEFLRWLVNPENWVYFDWRKIRDPHLRRLCELKENSWGDRWVSTGEAAAIAGCGHKDISRWIRLGKISSARRWGPNWVMLRSEAGKINVPKRGKGSKGFTRKSWSDRGDEFIVLARAVGISMSVLTVLLGIDSEKWAPYRLKYVHENGMIQNLIDRSGYAIEYRENAKLPELLANWQAHKHIFPFLDPSVKKFLNDEKMSRKDCENVRGILYRSAHWHRECEDPRKDSLIGGLQSVGPKGTEKKRLSMGYQRLLARGIDPLG